MNAALRRAGGCVVWSCVAVLLCSRADASPADEARHIMETAGVKGGLVVHMGCGEGRVTAALRASDSFLVHGLDASAGNIREARRHIQSLGLYGPVSVEHWTAAHLPYADNLVNLVVSADLRGIPMDEVRRVLAPDGVACIRQDGAWIRTVKPRPEAMDEWSHYLHDAGGNAVAADSLVGPPRYLQWLAGPLYCRSHEIDSSVSALVSAGGRLFYILDEGPPGITDERLPAKWSLITRDAFNGVLLWKRPVPHWGWREWKPSEIQGQDWTGLRGQRLRSPLALPRRLVAHGDRLYVTLGYRDVLSELDAATGHRVRTFAGSDGTDEIVCSDDVLVLCIRNDPAGTDRRRTGDPMPDTIGAFDARTGQRLWTERAEHILPMSLAAQRGRVFFHDGGQIVCLDLKSGQARWRTPCGEARTEGWNSAYTLVAHDDRVLLLGPQQLSVISADSGDVLWTGPGGRGPGAANPPDLFVADGLVWYGGPEGDHDVSSTRARKSGHDLDTGRVRRIVDVPNLISPQHHFRCYRSKATERYLLWTKRGVEFLDLNGSDHMRHDWLRAPCRLGFMPCNGLLYMPPHQCFCYPGAKLNGFNALAPRRAGPQGAPAEHGAGRLEQGPAFAQAAVRGPWAPARGDWPTYRHDAGRSGSSDTAVPAELKHIWHADVGGRLTPPVQAWGKLLVASIDTHTVHCLDAATGEPAWQFTAGGRVDSPPTIHQGLVLFGSADGWVYCLQLLDGELVWRFHAAPEARRIVAFDQVESAWPVHGSVLIHRDLAYFAAGRSTYLDGGIHLYALDPGTGEIRHRGRVDGPHPDLATDVGRPFDMEGTQSDILVTDGSCLYLGQVVFDASLVQQPAPRVTEMGDRTFGRHLFATGGFLNDTGWNRTFWMYSQRWPGYYIANQAPKAGQILVFDDTTTYGVKCYTTRNRHSPMFFPGRQGYLLFADDNDTEPMLVGEDRKPEPVRWLPEVNEAIGHALDSPGVDKDKGTGFVRTRPPRWAEWVPVRVRAMVLAKDTLFAAGPPDALEADDPLATLEGRSGAVLRAVSASSGVELAEYPLNATPVFDGMIAAAGRLYLSLHGGKVLCMGNRE